MGPEACHCAVAGCLHVLFRIVFEKYWLSEASEWAKCAAQCLLVVQDLRVSVTASGEGRCMRVASEDARLLFRFTFYRELHAEAVLKRRTSHAVCSHCSVRPACGAPSGSCRYSLRDCSLVAPETG